MSLDANSEFQFIVFKKEYKCQSCEALNYEILKLKKNLVLLTKIDNGILQKIVEQINSQQNEISFIKDKVFEDHIYDSVINVRKIVQRKRLETRV